MLSSSHKFHVLSRPSTDINMFRGSTRQPILTIWNWKLLSHFVTTGFHFIFQSIWDRTVNGYGLEYLQQIYLFSKTSKRATSPTHSAIPLVPLALFLMCVRHKCHHSPTSAMWLTDGHIPPLKTCSLNQCWHTAKNGTFTFTTVFVF